MFKSSLNKAKLDDLYDRYYSNAVRLYANFLKAKSKIDIVYVQNRDINVANYSALMTFAKVIENWFLENIDPNILIDVAKVIKVPSDNNSIGSAFIVNELYLSNKTYSQFANLIPLTIEEFNNSNITNAYNVYKNSLKKTSNYTYKDAQADADKELKKFSEYVREVYSDYYNAVRKEFLDDVYNQAKILYDSEVKYNG